MFSRGKSATVALGIASLLTSPPSPADPSGTGANEALTCPGRAITILQGDAAAPVREICHATSIALAFMASHGFDTDISVRIRIVDRPIMLHAAEAVGTYDAPASLITVPTYERCCGWAEKQKPFGLGMTRDLWRSFVVHELAHAVAYVNFRPAKRPRVAHEYIAYVTQIATLPPALIEEILENYPTRAFTSERQINRHFLDLDPQLFAVKAYRHFLELDDRAAFIARILNGQFRQFERD